MASANSTIINWHEILRYSNILFPSLFNAGDLVDYIMILLTHTIKLMRVMCDWRRISSKPQAALVSFESIRAADTTRDMYTPTDHMDIGSSRGGASPTSGYDEQASTSRS